MASFKHQSLSAVAETLAPSAFLCLPTASMFGWESLGFFIYGKFVVEYRQRSYGDDQLVFVLQKVRVAEEADRQILAKFCVQGAGLFPLK